MYMYAFVRTNINAHVNKYVCEPIYMNIYAIDASINLYILNIYYLCSYINFYYFTTMFLKGFSF